MRMSAKIEELRAKDNMGNVLDPLRVQDETAMKHQVQEYIRSLCLLSLPLARFLSRARLRALSFSLSLSRARALSLSLHLPRILLYVYVMHICHRRKLQRSVSESTNQEDFSHLASIKVTVPAADLEAHHTLISLQLN